MSASFPNAKKTFSQVVDGTTVDVAALYNSAYDEIEAIETFTGATGGGAQAYSESMTNLLLKYRRGCSVDYKGTADLYVRSGEIMIYDASGNRRLRRNTSDTTVTWSNIDTGSEANSTVYYVYAVADSAATTFTVKVSTNSATPTGCTFYKLIGTFYNNSSGNIEEVCNLNRDCAFGNWVAKTIEVNYLAITDGFVVATLSASNGNAILGYTDASATPTTLRASSNGVLSDVGGNHYTGSICMPVRKGDYWRVDVESTGTCTLFWLPMG